MKKISIFCIAMLLAIQSFAQLDQPNAAKETQAKLKLGDETPAQKAKRMEWWSDARFGMFIHWGLYSIPARHEWVKTQERIPEAEYQKYFDAFNPDLYNPKEWAKKAKEAGMKYVVLTTKHHEGFCLFDSEYTDYKATNTLAKRDLLKEFVEAVRAEGLRVGFYYSVVDWHHPDFLIDLRHPMRPIKEMPNYKMDWNHPDLPSLNKNRDMEKYRTYMKNQLTELLTKYGKIDELWLDFVGQKGNGSKEYQSEELVKLIRRLQPNVILNDRLGLKLYEDAADFKSPEQVGTEELKKYRGQLWETCQTFSGPWGYTRDDNGQWKSNKTILDLLITSVANGGNLLFNVGPTSRGLFDYRTTNALDSIGAWMKFNSPSIYGCTYAPDEYIVPSGTKLTYNAKAKKLYVHLFDYPKETTFTLPGYKDKVVISQVLSDASELRKKTTSNNDLVLILPKDRPKDVIPVIELSLR